MVLKKGLNEPRYPNLKALWLQNQSLSKKYLIFIPGNKTEIIEMKLPPAKSGGKIFSNGKEDIPELVRLLREEAKVI
ncbi:MAG: hypothetical protein R2942_13315 [Ignavibacteria bacterium]